MADQSIALMGQQPQINAASSMDAVARLQQAQQQLQQGQQTLMSGASNLDTQLVQKVVAQSGNDPDAFNSGMQQAAQQGSQTAAEYLRDPTPLAMRRLQMAHGGATLQGGRAVAPGGAQGDQGGMQGGGDALGSTGLNSAEDYAFRQKYGQRAPEDQARLGEGFRLTLQMLNSGQVRDQASYDQMIDTLKAQGHPEAEQMRRTFNVKTDLLPLIDRFQHMVNFADAQTERATTGTPYVMPAEPGNVLMGGLMREPIFRSAVTGQMRYPEISGTPQNQGALPQETLSRLATLERHGQPVTMTDLGGRAMVMINNPLLQKEIDAQNRGESPDNQQALNMLSNRVGLRGENSEARALGQRTANIDTAAKEADRFTDLSIASSQNLPRGSFVPLTEAIQMVQSATSSPQLKDFVIKAQALANAAATVAGRGTPNQMLQEKYMKELSAASSPEAYAAAARAIQQEARAVVASTRDVRGEMLNDVRGGGFGAANPSGNNAADAQPGGAPAPMPSDLSQLKPNTTYQTPRGPAVFTGMAPVKAPDGSTQMHPQFRRAAAPQEPATNPAALPVDQVLPHPPGLGPQSMNATGANMTGQGEGMSVNPPNAAAIRAADEASARGTLQGVANRTGATISNFSDQANPVGPRSAGTVAPASPVQPRAYAAGQPNTPLSRSPSLLDIPSDQLVSAGRQGPAPNTNFATDLQPIENTRQAIATQGQNAQRQQFAKIMGPQGTSDKEIERTATRNILSRRLMSARSPAARAEILRQMAANEDFSLPDVGIAAEAR